MAYLNTELSKQDSGFIAEDRTSKSQLSTGGSSCYEYPENSNFYIACKLKDEKSKLINLLSQFPVTGLWLLNHYEQKCCVVEQDDDGTQDSELSNALVGIRKCFDLLSSKSSAEACFAKHKQNLITELMLFPFCFTDLTKIIDVIVYGYKYRELCYQPSMFGGIKKDDLILKRLEGVNQRISTKDTKLPDLLSAYDEQFLFLSICEMQTLFSEVIYSENRWLCLRQQIASANSRLVLFIANQYKSNFLDFDDLVQEGQTGLLKAVDKFDHQLGFQFSTYAGYWIRQAISRSLSRCERVVHVPCGQVANINKVFRSKEQLSAQKGKDPTMEELAEHLKMSQDNVNTILTISQTAMPIDLSSDDGENTFSPIDFLEQQVYTSSFMKIAQNDLENLILKAITILNPREAKVICCHFGVNTDNAMTLQEIGVELNLTRERVRQIQVIALDKIKRSFGEQLAIFL